MVFSKSSLLQSQPQTMEDFLNQNSFNLIQSERVKEAFQRCISQIEYNDKSCKKERTLFLNREGLTTYLNWGAYGFIRPFLKASKLLAKKKDAVKRPHEVIFNYMSQVAKEKKSRDQMNICQSTCLGLCLSNSLLDFSFNQRTLFSSKISGLKGHHGICRDYTRLASAFLTQLEVEHKRTSYALPNPHSFLKLKLDDGSYYYAEAIAKGNSYGQCKFYPINPFVKTKDAFVR